MEKILTGYATELGAFGIFTLLVLKLVFDYMKFLKANSAKAPPSCPFLSSSKEEEWKDVTKKTRDLWEWHNKDDPVTGKKVWYADNMLTLALTRLADSTEANTKAMLAIDHHIALMSKDIEEIRADMREDSRNHTV